MGWDAGSLGPPVSDVQVELYTSGYRVSGHMMTRFHKVADILNLGGSTHLAVERATVAEYADPDAARGGQSVLVAVEAVLFGISSGVDDAPAADLVVQKRPVKIQVAFPPFWLLGTFHVPQGSEAMDVLNVADPFLSLTDAAVTSAAYTSFDGNAPIVAFQRKLGQVLIVTDDVGGSSLQELIPEDEARSWLPPEVEP